MAHSIGRRAMVGTTLATLTGVRAIAVAQPALGLGGGPGGPGMIGGGPGMMGDGPGMMGARGTRQATSRR
jgi:hypothetical protein